MRTFLIAAAMVCQTMMVVPNAMADTAAAPATAPFSVDTTDIGTLLDNPATKAVLMKHIPLVAGNDQINAARSMTLKQVQQFAPDALPDATLSAIQADLAKLPKP